MNILHIVKYYDPSQGGMESVVKNIVDGIVSLSKESNFTVYSNSHFKQLKKETLKLGRVTVIKEITPLFFKSQPLNLRYPSLKKLLIDNEIVHHHYPFPTIEFLLLNYLKFLKNKKIIITWHANIKNSRWSWIEKFYNPLIEKLLIKADFIVVTSPQLYEVSGILKKFSEKVKVIPLSFDPKYSSSEIKKFPENRCFELLFVGKLRKYKGVEYLIRAIEHLNVKLCIVGNGEEFNYLNNIIQDLNIENKITFLTNIDDEKLNEIYKKSDLFILPSVNEAEAFGVVQLEAMANGLPVINTNLQSGVPFVSLNNYSGFTVEPKNVDELKFAINKIINNKSLYESFSSNSLERVKLFSRERMSESYFNLYKELYAK